jgi:D-aminoacyl-tRNA deacylase
MKLVIQRVRQASVTVENEVVARIGHGALILIAVAVDDTPADAHYLAGKTSRLRIFDDPTGKLNVAMDPARGAYLVVSQFTLYGDCAKGNRPSYIQSAPPEQARTLYERYVRELKALGHRVETGRFQEQMLVELINDGPVTLLLESRGRST